MRFSLLRSILLLCALLSVSVAEDVVEVISIIPTANEQGLMPGRVMFTRSGSGSALTVDYRISGTGVAGTDYVAPVGSAPDGADRVGSVTFASNQVATTLDIVPIVNGVVGAKSVVVSIEPQPGVYITNSQSAAGIIIADADCETSLAVTLPVAYPTPPSLSGANLPIEAHARGEWHAHFTGGSAFRSLAVAVSGDAAIGPQAVQDTEYLLGYNTKTIAATSTDLATVVPINAGDLAPGPGATTIGVDSLALFTAGRTIVCFESPTDLLNGVYTVTGFTPATGLTNATITISPALKRIQTVYGATKVRRLAFKIDPPATGSILTYTLYGTIADVYYFAFPIISGNTPVGRRSINLTMLQSDDYRTVSPTSGSVTLADDAVTAGTRLASNAAKPSTTGAFDIVLTRAFPTAINVPFQVVASSSTATYGVDYTIDGVDPATLLGSVQIPANATTGSIVVQPISNADLTAETILIQLLPSPDYTLAPSGTSPVNPSAIMSVGPAPVTTGGSPVYLAISSATVSENVGTATLTVSLTNAAGASVAPDTFATPISVSYTTGGTAVPTADYSPLSGSLAINAGVSSQTITIPVIDNNYFTVNRQLILSLSPGTGYQISAVSSGTLTILEDEPIISVATGASPVAGGAAGIFNITSSTTITKAGGLTVQYSVNGTATPGTDYIALTGTTVIPQNQNSVAVQVNAASNGGDNLGKTIVLTVVADTASPPAYGVGATDNGTLTIGSSGGSGGSGGSGADKPTPGSSGSGGCGAGGAAGLLLAGLALVGLRRRRRI